MSQLRAENVEPTSDEVLVVLEHLLGSLVALDVEERKKRSD